MAFTKSQRDALPATDFAVPEKRKLPIHDERHVRLAWDMVSRTAGLSQNERKTARLSIMARADTLKIDTATWPKTEGHTSRLWCKLTIAAMAVELNIPTEDHPNKMPFSGVLTKLDQPSNAPPKGSGGRRTQVSLEAAERALGSLLGMAVDYRPGFTGHDPQQKIGVITAASIEGDEIRIGGFIYARDFPDAAEEIKENKDDLGFSFEAADVYVTDPDADILDVQALTFTGAAILQKTMAAYHSTSIAAEADEPTEEDEMDPTTKAELDKMSGQITGIVTAIGDLTKLVTVQASGHLDKVKPFADALEAEARKLEIAGIGLHPTMGHVAHLRRMAASMCAEASNGIMPSTFHGSLYASAEGGTAPAADALKTTLEAALKPITDSVAAMGTKIADMQAAAATAAGGAAPARKTLPPEITTLLAKAGITVQAEGEGAGKVSIAIVDEALKKAGIRGERAIEVKGTLHAAGVIE